MELVAIKAYNMQATITETVIPVHLLKLGVRIWDMVCSPLINWIITAYVPVLFIGRAMFATEQQSVETAMEQAYAQFAEEEAES